MESKKHLDLQLNAVEAISKLAEDNSHTQKVILEAGIVNPLLRLLKRSRQQDVQVCLMLLISLLHGCYISQSCMSLYLQSPDIKKAMY